MYEIGFYPSTSAVGVVGPLDTCVSLYSSLAWMSTVEALRPADSVTYVGVRRNGSLAGVCPVYRPSSSRRGFYDALGRFLRRADPEWPEAEWGRLAVVGGRAGYGTEWLISQELDPTSRDHVLRLMLEGAKETARGMGAEGYAILYATQRAFEEVVGSRCGEVSDGQSWFVAGADTTLSIADVDRDDPLGSYVEHVPARRRRTVRKELERFNSVGYSVGDEDLSEATEDAAALLAEHERRYGHPGDVEQEKEELALLSRHFGVASRLVTLRIDGALRGVTVAIAHGNRLYARATGLAAESRSHCEHFFLSLYGLVGLARRGDLCTVHLGQTSYVAKMLRSARAEPLWGYVESFTGGVAGRAPALSEWSDGRLAAVASGDPHRIEEANFP